MLGAGDADEQRLPVVFFRAGGCDFAVEAAGVTALRAAGADELATLPTVERLLGLAEAPPGDRRVMLLRDPAGGPDRPLVMPAAVSLGSLPAAAVHPLPPMVQHRSTLPAVRALALLDGRLTVLVALSV